MLVINANNQLNTTNYMLAEPWYPDLNSILIYGCPDAKLDNVARVDGGNNSGGTVEITPNDITVVDMVAWTYPINMYSPKVNKEALYSWNSIRTKTFWASDYREFYCDYWYIGRNVKGTTSANYYKSFKIWYNIAVKWLSSWQIVGEKIYAPMLLCWRPSDASYWVFWSTDANWVNPNPVQITFKLLHTDWTTTTITTIDLQEIWDTTQAFSFDSSVGGYVWGALSNCRCFTQYSATADLSQARFEGRYDGTWQTAQDWDYLVAEVRLNMYWAPLRSWATQNHTFKFGIYWGWANNNSMRDIYWFRPFQVSIRDA